MCGIVGIVRKSTPVEPEELQTMNNTQFHRGPDGEGSKIWGSVGIAHRRLSVIDLETGGQPMSTNDEQFWITYNGELYNYIVLKEQLESKGHIFKTRSDTEVILYAYKEWGNDCVSKFRGMFAFAIVNLAKKEIFLARDQFGIKPLVYRVTNDYFAFSSEINALKKIKGPVPRGNLKALDMYLTLQYIPAPDTIYKDIFKLKPAHYLIVDFKGRITETKKYFELNFDPTSGISHEDWLKKTEKVITESVNAHLIADVPFGVFLSGGIDSTLVALKMSNILGKPLKAFTIGFEEQEYSELKYAETVAKKIGIELTSEIVLENALNILPSLINDNFGEPFGDSSAIPTWYVSRLARKEVKMVLTGDGGDEMFGGYHSYNSWLSNTYGSIVKKKALLNQYSGIPRFLLGSLKQYIKNGFSANKISEWIDLMAYTHYDLRKKIWKNDLHTALSTSIKVFDEAHANALHYNRLSYAQYIDIHTYLPNDILTKVDICSMAHGLETRPPLIDVEVARIAEQLPLREKHMLSENVKQGKLILKKILLKDFTKEFVYRNKQGFAIPFNHWFFKHKENGKLFENLLLNAHSRLNRFFNPSAIKELWEGYNKNKGSFYYFGPLWLLFVFAIWLEENEDIIFETDQKFME